MRNALLATALCLSVLSVPVAAHAQGSSLKECEKDPLATACIDTIGKVLEDIAVGRKPTIDLPAGPSLDKLPLADLAKLLAPKKWRPRSASFAASAYPRPSRGACTRAACPGA